MAGSLTWAMYVADNGDKYSVPIAKHLRRATVLSVSGGGLITVPCWLPRDADYPPLPRGFAMRYMLLHPYPAKVGRRRNQLRLTIGNPAAFYLTQSSPGTVTFPIGALQRKQSLGWAPTATHGEVRKTFLRYEEYNR